MTSDVLRGNAREREMLIFPSPHLKALCAGSLCFSRRTKRTTLACDVLCGQDAISFDAPPELPPWMLSTPTVSYARYRKVLLTLRKGGAKSFGDYLATCPGNIVPGRQSWSLP